MTEALVEKGAFAHTTPEHVEQAFQAISSRVPAETPVRKGFRSRAFPISRTPDGVTLTVRDIVAKDGSHGRALFTAHEGDRKTTFAVTVLNGGDIKEGTQPGNIVVSGLVREGEDARISRTAQHLPDKGDTEAIVAMLEDPKAHQERIRHLLDQVSDSKRADAGFQILMPHEIKEEEPEEFRYTVRELAQNLVALSTDTTTEAINKTNTVLIDATMDGDYYAENLATVIERKVIGGGITQKDMADSLLHSFPELLSLVAVDHPILNELGLEEEAIRIALYELAQDEIGEAKKQKGREFIMKPGSGGREPYAEVMKQRVIDILTDFQIDLMLTRPIDKPADQDIAHQTE